VPTGRQTTFIFVSLANRTPSFEEVWTSVALTTSSILMVVKAAVLESAEQTLEIVVTTLQDRRSCRIL
jgi:hypothetical protein